MLYIIASIFLTSTLSRTLTLLVTLLCLAADGLLLARAARLKRDRQMYGVSSWMNSLATLFAALSLVAVFWQGLPALLVWIGRAACRESGCPNVTIWGVAGTLKEKL